MSKEAVSNHEASADGVVYDNDPGEPWIEFRGWPDGDYPNQPPLAVQDQADRVIQARMAEGDRFFRLIVEPGKSDGEIQFTREPACGRCSR